MKSFKKIKKYLIKDFNKIVSFLKFLLLFRNDKIIFQKLEKQVEIFKVAKYKFVLMIIITIDKKHYYS